MHHHNRACVRENTTKTVNLRPSFVSVKYMNKKVQVHASEVPAERRRLLVVSSEAKSQSNQMDPNCGTEVETTPLMRYT